MGGGDISHKFSNAYSSGTECPIDPKPSCKFEFVYCLKVSKKLTNSEGPLKLALLGPFWGPWRYRRVPLVLVEFYNDQKSFPTWLKGLENV